jgi:hypothetical protein
MKWINKLKEALKPNLEKELRYIEIQKARNEAILRRRQHCLMSGGVC